MKPYKITIESLLKNEHKVQRKIGREKKDTMRILYSDEKMFDLDSIYNSENDRIWIVNREEANRRDGKKKQQGKFAEKVIVWLTKCS